MYDHKTIDKKWQKIWKENKIYKTFDAQDKPKYYVLDMFPYPSGVGLHVGHPKGYIATDVYARFKMMNGFNVLHPMGWDAFGLPTENYAIKNKVHPKVATEENIKRFKEQLEILGFTYDWDREINTTDPNYCKWTQWIFLQMFKRGFAYQIYEPINWCPSCKTGLANEDLEDGKCERCGSEIEQKPMRQWALKITDYAEKLLDGLKDLDWEDSIIEMQKNWIGKSEGANVKFKIQSLKFKVEEESQTNTKYKILNTRYSLKVFTTRPDTLFGCTYMVVCPEHNLISNFKFQISNLEEVEGYVKKTKNKTNLERTDLAKEKTGVEIKGIKAINPVNGEEIPIFVADYILAGYGTGAIMAVPGHDERDFEFAKKYGLPIRKVVIPEALETHYENVISVAIGVKNSVRVETDCFSGEGININSEFPAQILDNTKTPENSEAFDSIEDCCPRREITVCHLDNNIIYNNNKNVKSNDGAEPVEGLEPSDQQVTNRDQRHATGTSASNALYQKNKNITKSLNGLPTKEAKNKMIEWLEENGIGKRKINYKLRDWVFSRQRYWGEPIPLIHCENCKNKKYNYIIIHGYGGSPEVNFFQWLKEELEKLGHTAVCPELPNTDEPNMDEQADYIINNFEINNNTVLVGHSLGGVVAMRLLEKTNKKVSKVLFVDSFIEPNFDDVDREQVKKSSDWNFDFKKIKLLSDEFVVLADKNHSVIPKNQPQKIAEHFDASLIITEPNEWHFCGESEPKILKQLLDQGIYPVPEKDLPLELPDVKNYEPSGTGESPLTNITEWVNTKCPKCNRLAKRETNTMPQWAGSCWYYLRYIDPKNNEKLVDPKKEKYWQPVDLYVGGAEHATRHLIYSRFWHHFLFDIGVVSTPEPFTKLQHVGLIMSEDGRKMSKRWDNVINPDDVVEKYGADAMRVYEMFMGPFDNAIAWSAEGLIGTRRFLERVWKLKNKINPHFTKGGWMDFDNKKLESLLHKTTRKVTNDIQNFKFNTAISAMMIFLNSLEREEKIDLKYYLTLLQLLSPFAPHITEELWNELGNKESIFKQSWPTYDESLIKDEEIELAIQINGKIRDKISASADITEEEAKELALNSEKIQQWLDGKEPKNIIFVKGKLVSIVV